MAQIVGDTGLTKTGRSSDERQYPHHEITHEIIAAAFEVHRELGGGFLEKVYERALALELAKRGLSVKTQIAIPVQCKGQPVGDYFADLLVDDVVLCEIKAGDALHTSHQAQLLHYLKATSRKVGPAAQLWTVARNHQTYGVLKSLSVKSVISVAKSLRETCHA